jgi:hypothetical protein
MEVYFNDMILYGNYLLLTNGRSVKNSRNGIFIFQDDSIVNLNLGIIVTNNKKNTHKDFALFSLASGLQTIELGSKNTNPQCKSWTSDSLTINYRGKVVVTQSTDGTITVKENEYCTASEFDGKISVSQVDYTKISVNTLTSSISEIYSGSLPVLEITAPVNVKITNNSGSLTFDTVKSVDLLGGNLTGNKVDSITGSADSSVELKISTVNTLSLKVSSFLTISLHNANTVTIEAESSIKINVTGEIKVLNINGESSVEIKGGTYEKITIEYCDGSFNLSQFTYIGELIISSDSFVNISGQSADIINVKKSDSKAVIKVKSSKNITVYSDSAVTIEGEGLDNINVEYADGAVNIKTTTSTRINVKSDSSVNITGSKVDVIDVTYADSRVEIEVDTTDNIHVVSDSAVTVKTNSGEQTVSIEADSRVDLQLAKVKNLKVFSDSAVSVSAYHYYTKPNITADGRITVTDRK